MVYLKVNCLNIVKGDSHNNNNLNQLLTLLCLKNSIARLLKLYTL